jgi:catechol 2,3-dioxygenase
MGITIERVGHVVLKVRELARSVPFYTRVLGLREVGRYGPDMVFFTAHGGNHHDLAIQEVGGQARPADPAAVGLVHVALKIGDSVEALRAAKAELEAAGVPILRMENHVVSKSIYFCDPDGNELEVYVDSDPGVWRDDPSAVASVQPLAL